MYDKLMSFLPKGQGTYHVVAAGVVIYWLMALIPGVADFIGWSTVVTTEDALKLTWEGLAVMFFRRGLK